jgi:hypothetical protein
MKENPMTPKSKLEAGVTYTWALVVQWQLRGRTAQQEYFGDYKRVKPGETVEMAVESARRFVAQKVGVRDSDLKLVNFRFNPK